jgi:hypothetical protein
MEEIWKKIPSLDGLYEASNFGRIKSYNTHYHKKEAKILSLNNNGNGYLYFTISIKNKRRNVYVHRAVCEAFNATIKEMNFVNHLNGIKNDNRIENLEWCNSSMNMRHAFDTGLCPKGGKKKNAIKLIDIETNMIFDCIKDAANFYNINYGTMKDALGKNNFKYKNPIYSRLKKLSFDRL